MNNVWTAIAFRAPCAVRHMRPTPILHLFNGYSRFRSSRASIGKEKLLPSQDVQKRSILASLPAHPQTSQHDHNKGGSRQPFSTSDILSAKKKSSKRVKHALPPSDSKLEPAPTVASYTEGRPDADEDLTWRDYDPAGGMPIPGGERSQPQINAIFQSEKLDADTGNYILSVMHWRRMSGALIDVGVDLPRDSEVTREQAIQGLGYVRSLAPDFDEQAAGQVWVDEESLRLQEQLRDRAVKLRLYKREEEPPEDELPIEEPLQEEQGTEYGRRRTRDSQLQRLREENEANFEAEQAQRAAAEAKAELSAAHTHRGPLELGGGVQPSVELVTYTRPDGIAISRPQTKVWLPPVERKPWVKYYEEQAQIVSENSIPQLSNLRRLGPSLLMLLFILSSAFYISENYTPPPKSARLWPDTSPAVATLTALTGTMVAFFFLSRLPPFWRTLSKYFTLVPVYPYSISLIGGAFRHQPFSHLVINTASIWFFGLILHEDVGRGTFLSIFFASGACGAYTSLVYHVLKKNWATYIFGSSGCALGVVAAACALRPNSTIKIAGQEVPIAVWVWLMIWGVAEVAAMVRFKGLSIDHAGHVGGLVAGFAAGTLLRRKANSQKATEEHIAVRRSDVNAVPST